MYKWIVQILISLILIRQLVHAVHLDFRCRTQMGRTLRSYNALASMSIQTLHEHSPNTSAVKLIKTNQSSTSCLTAMTSI